MSSCGMADSAELAVLTQAVDDYCARHGIRMGPSRDEIATRVMQLFRQGVTDPIKLSDGLKHLTGRIGSR